MVTIKFTWEISYDKIAYLNVLVSFEDGVLSGSVYHKSTDTH